MKLRLDYNNMMKEFVGDEGFSLEDFKKNAETIKKAFESVHTGAGRGMMGWTELPKMSADILDDIITTAEDIRENFENFVILGIGGSALGPIAVTQALCHMHHNELSKKARGGAPRFYVEDNVDPERMLALLDVVDIKKTCFNVITKSGSTSETMTQYLIVNDLLKNKLGKNAARHIVATTSKDSGNLIKIARAEGYKTFFIPDGVGGRFSELSAVGLLPAAVLGIDICEMLAGAAEAMTDSENIDIFKNKALMAGVLQWLAIEKNKNISVMMPYADGLKFFADWYAQLWGESLGKNKTLGGKFKLVGQTPVKALGVTDQHSQVQLYAEGPNDKVITFLAVDRYRATVAIPDGCKEYPDVHFLSGHSMNELIDAERLATEYAITKAGKLNHTIYIPEINANTIGQLMMFFMMKTAYAGALLGIDTFNQPGVEEGKNATYALLGRAGYEAKKQELDVAPAKKNDYVIA